MAEQVEMGRGCIDGRTLGVEVTVNGWIGHGPNPDATDICHVITLQISVQSSSLRTSCLLTIDGCLCLCRLVERPPVQDGC